MDGFKALVDLLDGWHRSLRLSWEDREWLDSHHFASMNGVSDITRGSVVRSGTKPKAEASPTVLVTSL